MDKKTNYEALIPGAKVYFYKPPSQAETQARGRKAKHLDHYIGPATIVRQVGSRSFIIQYTSYFTTEALALDNYGSATFKERLRSLKEAMFCKTWSLADGSATAIAPVNSKKRSLLWTGKIPTDFLDEQLLVRNVGLSSQGKLDDTTSNLAARLKIPHHVGA